MVIHISKTSVVLGRSGGTRVGLTALDALRNVIVNETESSRRNSVLKVLSNLVIKVDLRQGRAVESPGREMTLSEEERKAETQEIGCE